MKKFSLRRYTSLVLFLSFVMILLTGVVLYIAPRGSIARWLHWGVLSLDRAQWETLHTIFSYLFVAFALIHLFFINWKAFLSYLKRKIKGGEKRKMEVYYALATTLLVFTLTLKEVRPVYSIMELGNRISDSWEKNSGRPPVPGLEDMTLDEIAEKYFELEGMFILDQLRDSGFKVSSSEQSIRDIARQNDVGTGTIYESIGIAAKP